MVELEAIAEFQRQHGRRSKEGAQRATDAVRKAISRFHQRLANTLDTDGIPHPVLRAFAHHIESFILASSRRCSGHRNSTSVLVYEPPKSAVWLPHQNPYPEHSFPRTPSISGGSQPPATSES